MDTAGNLIIQAVEIKSKKDAATTAFGREKSLKELQNKLNINLEKIKNSLNFQSDVKLKELANKLEQENIKLTKELENIQIEKNNITKTSL